MAKEINLLERSIESASSENFPTQTEEIKKIIEALLFSSDQPLSLEKIKMIVETTFPVTNNQLKQLLCGLQEEYQRAKKAFQLEEIAGGYLLRTTAEMEPYVTLLHQNRREEKLSKASMEVLAIIAYKQPITRQEIEKVRGVDCSFTLTNLLEKELVEIVGKLEGPGRAAQYGVTKRFLRHFGLKDRRELQK